MKITIVVPCYNSMKYIEQCMTSVLNQNYNDYEVWAYDNESTDGTYEYLLDLEKEHSRLTVFQLPNIYPNGYGEAQEHVIENAKSDYITFIGSDDLIESDYITKCMKVIAHNPDKIKCIQSGIRGIRDGKVVNQQIHSYKSLKEFKEQCLIRSPVNTPTVVWHKSVVPFLRTHEAHDASEHTCIGGGDYDTYCYLADKGIFIYPVPSCLGYYYRWHEGQCTWKVHESKKQVDYDKIIQEYWKNKWTL
tara:strand:- start:71 stop:811 length:741 start_codon:yes stop_codon:yes gene_type:complete